jgi:hypothetical protein
MTMNAQTNVNFFPTTLGGNASMGITTAPILSAPQFQLHGITDYTQLFPGTPAISDAEGVILFPAGASTTTLFGKTSRFAMTNTTTGLTALDGTVIRQSGLDFNLQNMEGTLMTFRSNQALFRISGVQNRFYFGTGAASTAIDRALVNIEGTDNGIFIKTSNTNKFGLSVQMASSSLGNALQVLNGAGVRNFSVNSLGQMYLRATTNTTNSIEVRNTTDVKNFTVTGDGYVFARKYTTTLLAIPDYVFAKDYKLMPFSELRTYLYKENHLPNVPSAKEFEKNGVDLGELNRLLLEKVEEAHLYILQLEARLKALEDAKK